MKVKLDDIEIYAGTQARQGIDQETVDKYAERMIEGDRFPDVVLFHDGSGYYIGDGHHRVLASIRNEFVDIEADVRKGTQQDALWYALGANRTNGKGMTRGDLRHAVAVALKTWPDKTQQAIADQVGCSQPFVHKVKEDIITSNNISLPETRTDTMGRTRPTTYKKQEPEPPEPQAETDVTASCNVETETEETPDETCEEQEERAEKRKKIKYTPPANAVHFVKLAMMHLKQIQKDDTRLCEAISVVREWLEEMSAE